MLYYCLSNTDDQYVKADNVNSIWQIQWNVNEKRETIANDWPASYKW